MTNPIFEHLPPGPQRDEAEVESRLATARETIARLERERDEARAEAARLQKLFDDAGAGQYDVPALVEHYQDEAIRTLRERCDACDEAERKLVDASRTRRHEQIETYARIAKLERRVAAERRSRRGLREGKKSAERINADAILRLHSLADSMSEHVYQELASALEAPPRQDRPPGDRGEGAPMIRVRVTDDDYQRALHRFTLLDWKQVKAEARCQAAQRMLDENAAARKRAIDEQQAVLGRAHTVGEFLASSDRVDLLFREQDELLDIAFPRAKEKR